MLNLDTLLTGTVRKAGQLSMPVATSDFGDTPGQTFAHSMLGNLVQKCQVQNVNRPDPIHGADKQKRKNIPGKLLPHRTCINQHLNRALGKAV